MRDYMTGTEIFDELDAVRGERSKAEAAVSWGNGHRARWYTDLDPLIELLKAWDKVQDCNVHCAAWDTLAEMVPGGADLLTTARLLSEDEDTSDLEEAVQREYDRRVEDAKATAMRLAREVAEAEYKTLPERLAEKCYDLELDDMAEEIRTLTPTEAARRAFEAKIMVDDQEGSKGVTNANEGTATGWALTRTWGNRETTVVEF